MKIDELKIFELLKKAISVTFLSAHSAPTDIKNWKGEDILAFQEDLLKKVKGSISEKWFYTYFKNDADKLPRIDMLNLLSKYAGYKNWSDFKNLHSDQKFAPNRKKAYKNYGWLLLVIVLIASIYQWKKKNNFHFCFTDGINNERINNMLDIKILQDDESPLYLKTDTTGCFSYETKKNTIHFVVQSPYYKTDTIFRTIQMHKTGIIQLSIDDYALMLQYYATTNVKDWRKRKQNLDKLISDNASIYQIYPGNSGIELYSKQEFINKLLIPTSSLKNLKIVERSYENNKIVKLKFIVQ